ncbi:MAG: choice-of-anchor I family protein [Scytonema sp. PMC 1069.18]|nr:choice-of-anchor I family protein [Scytonema sp. PMC 1069.18]MEC4887778.1 choice-of-anchor I family protein [Scytonema sp. PMC 1070.18]
MVDSIKLTPIGRYATGIFDEGAAEIPAYDPVSQRLFVINADSVTVDVLDLSHPTNPTKLFTIGAEAFGGSANSVAVKNGIVAIAVESENTQEPGKVVFTDTHGNFLNSVTVGALPDMLTFTPDGKRVLVANEGEPNDDYTVDPEGSVSIIDISGGVEHLNQYNVTTAGFGAFNDQLHELRNAGVRIFGPNATVAQDLEPEYITISPDSKTAWVTLQENNALAVINIEHGTVTDIVPLGFKDHNAAPSLETYFFDPASLPTIGTTESRGDIKLSGFSGLYFEGVNPENGNLQFITHPDRGPDGGRDENGNRIFLLPDLQPQLVRFELDKATGQLDITERIFLKRQDGTPLTGLPNLEGLDPDTPATLSGDLLEFDPLGADLEGVVRAPDGTYWAADEYRPAIYHFQADGTLIDRFVPQGLPPEVGTPAFPEVYSLRQPNRGFEAIAYQDGKVYAFVQSPLNNPDAGKTATTRILEFDPVTKTTVGEYLYIQDGIGGGSDKIGDAAALDKTGEFLVVERDSGFGADSIKNVYRINLADATNLQKLPGDILVAGETFESLTKEQLSQKGIKTVTKEVYADLAELGYTFTDKPEGLALVNPTTIAVLNDNDFGETGVPIGLGLVSLNNALDASDRDGAINIRNWAVNGMYQPDAIASFEINGQTYLITANEGDTRDYDGFSEEARVKDLKLDPTAFPNAKALQADDALGRLTVTKTLGDTDGDGDFDKLYSFGGRSFSIWDTQGHLIYDSGNEFEVITAQLFPEYFNSDNSSNDSFDSRSDAKGPEPEGVVTGVVGDNTYAFIGLERIGGVMVYDVTNPTSPNFIQYINPRDFSVEFNVDEEGEPRPTKAQILATGDLGPEGLVFISAENSPNGKPLLVVANEVSGSTTVYEVDKLASKPSSDSVFTLQLLHASDQEAGVPALDDAPNFSAVLNALKNQDANGDGTPDYPNTLVLSSGDAYIPSPFFFASDTAFGGQGRADILIQNELGFQAIGFGNHEFDLGTDVVAGLIQADAEDNYPGTNFPYLSSNLDFSTDAALAKLVTADGQEAGTIPNKITGSTIITVNGEKIGVVGATTPTLRAISSPGGVTVLPANFDDTDPADVAALAAEIQTSVDALLADNPGMNKVILLTHMQQIAIEQQLAELLTNVDVIVAGGSNTLLADETDRLRAGDTVEGPYPILKTAADGNPIAVVNTDGNYKYVGRLVVDFDANGVIIPDSVNPNISGAYATDSQGVTAVAGTPDPDIVEITDALREVVIAQDGNIFGSTSVFLNGSRGDVRTEETNLGNLSADANLVYAQQIDPSTVISIKNGGGIRDNIGVFTYPPGSTNLEDALRLPPQANPVAGKEEGDISQLDITNALRFNNGLSLLTLTAQELLEVVEYGVAATAPGATPGRFPQISGFAFSFDPDLAVGDRVQSLAVRGSDGNIDVVVENGELVGDPTRTFRTVTLSFLADGGDGYSFPSTNRVDLVTGSDVRTGTATFAADGSEQDAFAEYLSAFFKDVPYNTEDVPPAEDTRIQNLNFRSDTVLANMSLGQLTPIATIDTGLAVDNPVFANTDILAA